jgi:hypothetical protein
LIDDEGTADIDSEHLVEGGEVEVDERCEVHPAGRVYDDVDTTEESLDLVEEAGHCLLVGNVTSNGCGRAPSCRDLVDDIFGARGVAGVVDNHAHSVGAQTPCDRPSDTT